MRITFRLREDRDGDIIRWLRSLPEDPGRSYAIRKALRGAIRGPVAVSRPTTDQRVSVKQTPLPENTVVLNDTIPQVSDAELEKKLDTVF